MTNAERFERYLASYASKDLAAVAGMFAEDITLRDWKISVSGKALAVAETKKNFDCVETIEIDILNRLESEHSVAGELKITVDGSEVLYLVDVVRFTPAGRIASIKAYIGRED